MKLIEASSAGQPSRETVAEAAAWISRLHSSNRSPQVEAALRSWLSADKQNAQAFEGMTEIWDTMPAMRAGEFPPMFEADRLTTSRRRTRAAVIIAGVAGLAALAAYGLLGRPVYTTDIGEQRIVNLRDGTRVSLNSGTRMRVNYTETERGIELNEGEAYFEVGHDPRVPFIVVAGANRVTALGTSFAIRFEGSKTSITLVEGKVAVGPVPASAFSGFPDIKGEPGGVTVLSPGQRLVVTQGDVARIDSPKVEALTAWRRGEVIFDETILADAAAEMNRHDRMPLVIDDPAIAALPVSGIYRTGDTPGFARVVAKMYDLAVVHGGGRILLKGQPKGSP